MKMLEGKTALVTGGSRGIGRAVVLALAEAGANVAINYNHSNGAAAEVCDLVIGSTGVRAKIYKADVSREDEAHEMVRQIFVDFGPVHILVNNAGINRDRSFLKMTKMLWDEVLGINLDGPFNVTHEVLPEMLESGWGRIINIASIVGQTGNFGQANFAVTKAGLIGFTKTLAREVARKGITVNAVAPGYIETDMTRDIPAPVIDQVRALTPIGRLGRPEEVADAILWLARPQSGYITGQVIAVNGGMYM